MLLYRCIYISLPCLSLSLALTPHPIYSPDLLRPNPIRKVEHSDRLDAKILQPLLERLMHRIAEDVELEILLRRKLGQEDDLHPPVELLGRGLLPAPQGADVRPSVELAGGLEREEALREGREVGGAGELECDWGLARYSC